LLTPSTDAKKPPPGFVSLAVADLVLLLEDSQLSGSLSAPEDTRIQQQVQQAHVIWLKARILVPILEMPPAAVKITLILRASKI
jgi:hypothetical protein